MLLIGIRITGSTLVNRFGWIQWYHGQPASFLQLWPSICQQPIIIWTDCDVTGFRWLSSCVVHWMFLHFRGFVSFPKEFPYTSDIWHTLFPLQSWGSSTVACPARKAAVNICCPYFAGHISFPLKKKKEDPDPWFCPPIVYLLQSFIGIHHSILLRRKFLKT